MMVDVGCGTRGEICRSGASHVVSDLGLGKSRTQVLMQRDGCPGVVSCEMRQSNVCGDPNLMHYVRGVSAS
jgi:hypothetical protein